MFPQWCPAVRTIQEYWQQAGLIHFAFGLHIQAFVHETCLAQGSNSLEACTTRLLMSESIPHDAAITDPRYVNSSRGLISLLAQRGLSSPVTSLPATISLHDCNFRNADSQTKGPVYQLTFAHSSLSTRPGCGKDCDARAHTILPQQLVEMKL